MILESSLSSLLLFLFLLPSSSSPLLLLMLLLLFLICHHHQHDHHHPHDQYCHHCYYHHHHQWRNSYYSVLCSRLLSEYTQQVQSKVGKGQYCGRAVDMGCVDTWTQVQYGNRCDRVLNWPFVIRPEGPLSLQRAYLNLESSPCCPPHQDTASLA